MKQVLKLTLEDTKKMMDAAINKAVEILSLIHIPSPRDQRGSRMPSSA